MAKIIVFLVLVVISQTASAGKLTTYEIGQCIGSTQYYTVSYSYTGNDIRDWYTITKNSNPWDGAFASSGQDPDAYCSPQNAGNGSYFTIGHPEFDMWDDLDWTQSNTVNVPLRSCSSGGQ